jgi:hypothetical protein
LTHRPERAAVRWGVPALLVGSCAGAAIVSLNASKPDIPSFAFGSHVVLAVQVALILFYGALLLLVPLVRALDGDLPIELSLKGARWTEDFRGIEDEFLIRQASAEARALQADADRMEEVRLLRQELEQGDPGLEELVVRALERIDALEEEGGSRSSRR